MLMLKYADAQCVLMKEVFFMGSVLNNWVDMCLLFVLTGRFTVCVFFGKAGHEFADKVSKTMAELVTVMVSPAAKESVSPPCCRPMYLFAQQT